VADVIFIAVMVVFFALCVLFVHACDRIIGPDETSSLVAGGVTDEPTDPLADIGGGDPEMAPVGSVAS
jgi:hypothetical protein